MNADQHSPFQLRGALSGGWDAYVSGKDDYFCNLQEGLQKVQMTVPGTGENG